MYIWANSYNESIAWLASDTYGLSYMDAPLGCILTEGKINQAASL